MTNRSNSIQDTEDVVARAIALREECRKGVEERGVMPDYCDACIALKALAPKLLDAAQSLSDRIDVMREALRAADNRLCELVGPRSEDEATRVVINQIREASRPFVTAATEPCAKVTNWTHG